MNSGWGWYRLLILPIPIFKDDYLNIKNDIELITGDITDENNMSHLIKSIKPNEFYNLAAQSFVGSSWELNKLTTEVNAIGPLNILNAIRLHNPETKFYQASTSEMYGNANDNFQNEKICIKRRWFLYINFL